LDFDDAILAHSQWKLKLALYVSRPDRSLSPSEVAADNNCQLGQWLMGEGLKYSELPEHTKLVSDHAHFHRAAAEVVKKADSGKSVEEEIAPRAPSEFASASTAIVQSLMAMRKRCDAR